LTPAQLKEFEEILRNRFQKLQAHIQTFLQELDEIEALDGIEDINELEGVENLAQSDREFLEKLLQQKKLLLLALEKIQNGTYGYCKDGKEIAIEILKQDPLYEC